MIEMPFIAYTGSFELAARELVNRPEAQGNEELQDSICRKYGIFLDSITDEEAAILCSMIKNYSKGG